MDTRSRQTLNEKRSPTKIPNPITPLPMTKIPHLPVHLERELKEAPKPNSKDSGTTPQIMPKMSR